MKLTEMFLSQLEAEGLRTERTIEQVPDGHDDWKPHDTSMAFGRLAMLVAGMPSWFEMMIARDHLDVNPPGGSNWSPPPMRTREERVQAVRDGVARTRAALQATNDQHLMQPWRLLAAGKVMTENPRHVVLRDTFMHLAHHRGQLTVYLRMLGATVPAIYGPSADDNRFM